MAKAYKCDRCCGLYEDRGKHEYAVTKMYWNTPNNPKEQDLCPKCYKSFEHWWLDIYYESAKEE